MKFLTNLFWKTIQFFLGAILWVSLLGYTHAAYLWNYGGKDFLGRDVERAPVIVDWVLTALTPLGWRLDQHIERHWTDPAGLAVDILLMGGIVAVYAIVSSVILKFKPDRSKASRHLDQLPDPENSALTQ